MARLTARKADGEVGGALGRGAVAPGWRPEAEHGSIPRAPLPGAEEDFAAWAEALWRRLRSSINNAEMIRADRDRNGMG